MVPPVAIEVTPWTRVFGGFQTINLPAFIAPGLSGQLLIGGRPGAMPPLLLGHNKNRVALYQATRLSP
jgi:hypothetical protein